MPPPRQKISKEEIPEVRNAIQELETEWDKKWTDTLKDKPLASFLNEDPVSRPLILYSNRTIQALYFKLR